MSDKRIENMVREELIDEVKQLRVELWRTQKAFERNLVETQETLRCGGCLLGNSVPMLQTHFSIWIRPLPVGISQYVIWIW